MSLRIDLLKSEDYALDEIQHSVWEKTRANYMEGNFSREGYYNHMSEVFYLAAKNNVQVFIPKLDKDKKVIGMQRYPIPCASLMGDPRNLSYYLEEVNGRRKRPTRLTERVRMHHLLLCLDAQKQVQL